MQRRCSSDSDATRAIPPVSIHWSSPMTAMALAVLTWDKAVAKPLSKIQPAFADCLPDLLK